jgi:hypothetical protein
MTANTNIPTVCIACSGPIEIVDHLFRAFGGLGPPAPADICRDCLVEGLRFAAVWARKKPL